MSCLSPTIFLLGNVGAGAGFGLPKTLPMTDTSFFGSAFCFVSLDQSSSSLSSNLTTVSPLLDPKKEWRI